MESFFDILLLGIVQGLSEFLPISSSGHLALFHRLIGAEDIFSLTIALHFGTLGSLLFFYRDLLQPLFKSAFQPLEKNLILKLLSASAPVMLVGLLFYSKIKNIFSQPGFLGFHFLLTGLFLLGLFFYRKSKKETLALQAQSLDALCEISYPQAFGMGCFQLLALLPGVSRSGMTIAGGMYLKVRPILALHFSFFMGAIALLAAFLLEAFKTSLFQEGGLFFFLGAFVSFLAGLLALHLTRAWLYQLYRFAFYLIPLGLLLLIFPFI